MSAKPRSSLKKRSGNQDDRRVSFASPLSSEKVDPPLQKKQLPISKGKASSSVVKKSKPADENMDIITLTNQQSEDVEEIFDIESKMAKQSKMVQDLSTDLASIIESLAMLSSVSAKIEAQIDEQSKKAYQIEANINELTSQADAECEKYESRLSAQTRYSSCLSELQKGFNYINCANLEKADDFEVDYEKLLSVVDELEACIAKF